VGKAAGCDRIRPDEVSFEQSRDSLANLGQMGHLGRQKRIWQTLYRHMQIVNYSFTDLLEKASNVGLRPSACGARKLNFHWQKEEHGKLDALQGKDLRHVYRVLRKLEILTMRHCEHKKKSIWCLPAFCYRFGQKDAGGVNSLK